MKQANLGRFVFGGGDKVRPVGRHLDIGDQHVWVVRLHIQEQRSAFPVVLAHTAVLVPSNDVLVQKAPGGDGGLALSEGDGEERVVGLHRVHVHDDGEDDDGAEMAHTHLRDGQ